MSRGIGARLVRVVLGIPMGLLVLAAFGWASAAIWFDGPASRPLAGSLVGALLVLAACSLGFVRPLWRSLLGLAVLWALVLGWWLGIAPRNDRDWQADVARLPRVTREGDIVTLHDVRNFAYGSEPDGIEHWEDRTYDLAEVQGFDLFVSYWGPTLIAHTIVSWEFADGRHLAVSIETRKEQGETYSAVRGFFRQYELYYVVADERDVVRLRTNYRGEQVFLYRIRASGAQARALLESYLEEIDRIGTAPEWYNALEHNCTTTIRGHVQQTGVYNPWDWRILANGRGDELLYARGLIDTSLPLAEVRARSDITAKAKAADRDPAFSQRIREGLLPRPSGA